ncbi:hypothetical protein DdX_07092 [Ditylenchus destructor]|uniref:Transposase n=1 Tax=Ditylenchus destructor TaxID=166010 RepID=A0AAD4N9Q4_9BILA|nr:hypothetical protein DdX_07092 [Ditylenchus destructor]
MEELRNFNGYDLYDRLINYTDEQFEDWLRYLGLLYPKNSRPCPKCNSPMTTRKVKDADKYPTYRCNNYKCRHETGFFVDTFFAGLHYPLKDVLHVSYMWCREGFRVEDMIYEIRRENKTKIGPDTVTQWKHFFREVTEQYFIKHPIAIGGPGVIVEIDETFCTKRKYNRGRIVEEQIIVLGGVERKSEDSVFDNKKPVTWTIEEHHGDCVHFRSGNQVIRSVGD